MASSHYARSVTNYLDEKNIRYVTKFDNPACVPELRPIEDFWSILKGYVYENNWEAESEDQLQKKIHSCLKKIDKNLVQGMCEHVYKKVDAVRRNGEKSLLQSRK